MKRKIIQFYVAVAVGADESGIIYVLCDDGTLWWKLENVACEWTLEKEVPQI